MRRLLSSRPGQFIVFLLSPEDSSTGGSTRHRNTQTPFDNRLCGAVKIAFWITVTVAFWSVLPVVWGVCCR